MQMQLVYDRGYFNGTVSYIDEDRQKAAGLSVESAVVQVALR
ncbi:hypothetical protein [Massilia eburnea]|nr:hypothetical protein [Massilia eburnea]